MLEEKDIQKIGEEVGKVIEQNITPVLDGMRGDIDGMRGDIEKIKSEMVTKSYLDDKLADIEGQLIGKLRKGDNKVNRLIEVLHNKSVLSNEDVARLNEFQMFPKM